jgi:cytochrome c-type biogenesis protein CcmH/NrfG
MAWRWISWRWMAATGAAIVIAATGVAVTLARPRSTPPAVAAPAKVVRFPTPSAAVPEGYAGLVEEAQTLVDWIVARHPSRPQSTALAATIAAERGDQETAAALWQTHLERHPETAEGWYRLGLYAVKEGRDAEAAEWLERARRLDPSLPDIQGHLGRCLLKSDRVDEAAEVLEPAIGDDRGGAVRLFHLGHARLRQEKNTEARAAFQGAIDRAASYTGAWYGLATALARLGLADDAERARAEFRRLKAEDAENAAKNLSRDESARMRRLLAGWYAAAGRIAALDGDTQEAKALLSRGAAVEQAALPSAAPPSTAAGDGR